MAGLGLSWLLVNFDARHMREKRWPGSQLGKANDKGRGRDEGRLTILEGRASISLVDIFPLLARLLGSCLGRRVVSVVVLGALNRGVRFWCAHRGEILRDAS